MKKLALPSIITIVMLHCITFRGVPLRADEVSIRASVTGKGVVIGGGFIQAGSQFTLHAAPQADWRFDHWQGVPESQAQDNPTTLTATEGLTPTAIMTPSEGAGRFSGGSVLAWTENGRVMTNITAGNAIDVSAGPQRHLIVNADGSLTEIPPNPLKPDLHDAISAEVGFSFSIALRKNGTVVAWGANDGQTNVPAGLTNVYAIAAGGDHALALKQDGTVVAWGRNSEGQASPPVGLHDVVAIGAGSHSSYAVKNDGSLVTWGKFYTPNGYGGIRMFPYVTNLVEIEAGLMHYAGVRRDGSIVFVGSIFEAVVIPPPTLNDAVTLTSGAEHVAALRANQTLATWGWAEPATLPEPPPENVVQVDAGNASTIAVLSADFGLVREERQTLFLEVGGPFRLSPRVNRGQAFQWFKNGQPITNSTSSEYYISAATLDDSGSYQLAVSSGSQWIAAPPTEVTIVATGYPRVLVNGIESRGSVRVANPATISLTTSLDTPQIFYTTNGATPTVSSTRYTAPFTIGSAVTIRALALSGDFSQQATNDPVHIDARRSFTLSIDISGPGRVVVTPQLPFYLDGDIVRLEAIPDQRGAFVRWANELTGSEPVREIVMNRDWRIEAVFQDAPKFSATIIAPPGTVLVNPSGPQYAETDVTITAAPKAGFTFEGWTGDFTGTTNSFVWRVTGPATFKASYATSIALTSVGSGHIELNPSLPRYEYGSQVQVIPVPDSGYQLALWGLDGTGKPLTAWTLTVTNAEPKISALFQATQKVYSFSDARFENGDLKFHVNGTAETSVIIQRTEDFVSWTDVQIVSLQDGSGADVTVEFDRLADQKYFRVKAQ